MLVALGLERVGAPFDAAKLTTSLDLLDSYRVGRHWYADGALANVDYYVPFAFHTYGLMYAAANDLGLGDDARAAAYRERAATFASDVQHWFAPDGAAVPFGRSLTYRFAMSSFWGALAWADVQSDLSWGAVHGLAMRNLRWWANQPISDRDGVLSIGYTYDNRRLSETYSSAGSPYWCMKAFGSLAAPSDHPFWTSDEEPLEPLAAPVTIADAGQVITRDGDQAVILSARPAVGLDFPEQCAAKYRKFAYSSVFGFSGDVADMFGSIHTDSMLALTDADGNRRVRLGVEAAGVEDAMTWSTWHPWPDVRVDSVCWAVDASRHGRVHRVRTERDLTGVESGFAIGLDAPGDLLGDGASVEDGRATIATGQGVSAIVDTPLDATAPRRPITRNLAVNASLVHPRTAVPALSGAVAGRRSHDCVPRPRLTDRVRRLPAQSRAAVPRGGSRSARTDQRTGDVMNEPDLLARHPTRSLDHRDVGGVAAVHRPTATSTGTPPRRTSTAPSAPVSRRRSTWTPATSSCSTTTRRPRCSSAPRRVAGGGFVAGAYVADAAGRRRSTSTATSRPATRSHRGAAHR